MIKISLAGYGKMGKMIEEIAHSKGIEIVSIIDPFCEGCASDITPETVKDCDVVIEFSHPDVVMKNIQSIAECGKNMVIGTTGWFDRMEEVEKLIQTHGVGLIWSGNFSIGVNVLFRIVENATRIFNSIDDYDVFMTEFHHNKKADSPSGTAEMIAKIIIDNHDQKQEIVADRLNEQIKPEQLHVSSTRGGSIPGIHSVYFDSPQDTIEITHSARNRQGFASGALMAAEFIAGKKGIFHINDLMKEIIKEK